MREIEVDDRAHDAIVDCGQWEEYARRCEREREDALRQLDLVREHARVLQVRVPMCDCATVARWVHSHVCASQSLSTAARGYHAKGLQLNQLSL